MLTTVSSKINLRLTFALSGARSASAEARGSTNRGQDAALKRTLSKGLGRSIAKNRCAE